MGKITTRTVTDALGITSAADRLTKTQSKLAELTRQVAESDAAHASRTEQLRLELAAAIDDSAAYAAADAALNAHTVAARPERDRLLALRDRTAAELPGLERAAKVEAFGAAQVQARKLREQLLRSVAAVVEAQAALDSVSTARDATTADTERTFATLRALATELGESAPIARWSAGAVAAAELLSTQYPVARRKIQEKADALSREMPRELWQRSIDTDFAELERHYRLSLLELYGLSDPFEVTETQYPNADRLHDLELDPARYEQRVSKLIHERATKNEALRVAFELSERERAEREYAERIGVQGT